MNRQRSSFFFFAIFFSCSVFFFVFSLLCRANVVVFVGGVRLIVWAYVRCTNIFLIVYNILCYCKKMSICVVCDRVWILWHPWCLYCLPCCVVAVVVVITVTTFFCDRLTCDATQIICNCFHDKFYLKRERNKKKMNSIERGRIHFFCSTNFLWLCVYCYYSVRFYFLLYVAFVKLTKKIGINCFVRIFVVYIEIYSNENWALPIIKS